MSYWDTSALAKLYLPEPDTPTFVAHATVPQPLVTSRLALYEMRRVALPARRVGGDRRAVTSGGRSSGFEVISSLKG